MISQRQDAPRTSIAVLLAVLLAPSDPISAQEPQDPAKLQALRQEKLAKAVFKKAAWLTDYDKAREKAKKEKKPILTYFTRSYAG